MISYGAQLSDLKRRVIDYITKKVEEGAFRNVPGDIKVSGAHCVIVEPTTGTTPLHSCSLERLCNIADKIHFRPISQIAKEEAVVKSAPVSKIQKNTPVPKQERRKRIMVDFMTLPLRKMELDDHIIIYPNCEPDAIGTRKHTAKRNLDKVVSELDLKGKYVVGVAEGNNIGIWRVK